MLDLAKSLAELAPIVWLLVALLVLGSVVIYLEKQRQGLLAVVDKLTDAVREGAEADRETVRVLERVVEVDRERGQAMRAWHDQVVAEIRALVAIVSARDSTHRR